MKLKAHLTLATAAIAGLVTLSGAWAAPGGNSGNRGNSSHAKPNHGTVVSSTARDKDDDTNHGKVVSSVAKSKQHSSTYYKDKNHKDKNYKNKNYKSNYKYRSKSDRLHDAERLRNQSVRQAQNNYALTRKSILKDRDEKRLSRSERERLQAAIRTRNEAIRRAQEQYRLTVRKIG